MFGCAKTARLPFLNHCRLHAEIWNIQKLHALNGDKFIVDFSISYLADGSTQILSERKINGKLMPSRIPQYVNWTNRKKNKNIYFKCVTP